METYAFWRERQARFLELASSNRAADLHATRVEVDIPAELEQASQRMLAAMTDPSAAVELLEGHAKWAARAGRLLLEGEPARRWEVTGGPYDRLARETLQNRFRAEAIVAAVGAAETRSAMTEQMNETPERTKAEFQRLAMRVTMTPTGGERGRQYYRADVVNSLPCLAGITEMREVSPSAVDRSDL